MTTDFRHAMPSEEALAVFEIDETTGLRHTWLGEDGEYGAIVVGHRLDARQVADVLDIDKEEVGRLEETWMVALSHSQGCEGFAPDTCEQCRDKNHDGCEGHCECADDDHEPAATACGCDQYLWWSEFLTEAEMLTAPAGTPIAVTRWEE